MATDVTLADDATHEDIQDAVDQIIEAQKGEDAPETDDASDASKLVSDDVVTERDPENTAEEDTPMADSDSEKTGKAETDWRKEAVAEASAYGIGEKEIADFQSREELERALKLFDRQIDEERTKLLEDGDKGGKDQEEEESSKEVAVRPKDGSYEVRLDPDVYDEDLVEEFTALRDHYDSRLAALEGHFAEAQAIAEQQQFDQSVDALEFSQLFGKTDQESEDELKRRAELFDRVQIEQEIMSRMGRNVDYNALVNRVARSLFPEEYDKRLLKNHTRKITKQSSRRQGGGTPRPTDAPEGIMEEMRQLYKELDTDG